MKKLMIFGAMYLALQPVYAEEYEVELLVQGCSEVEAIYDRKGEKHLYAGITTSVSEALRAGYCKGVIDQYRRSKGCYQRDWVEQAKVIAKENDSSYHSVDHLLRKSCG